MSQVHMTGGTAATSPPPEPAGVVHTFTTTTDAVRTISVDPALAAHWDAGCVRLAGRLPTEPPDRFIRAASGTLACLEDYLATRLVELCVHADDPAVRLQRSTPALPAPATETAIAVLVEMGRLRPGDVGVPRALAHREREGVAALRVM